MRQSVQPTRRVVDSAALALPPRAESASEPIRAFGRPRLTVAGFGFLVYLWVVHSFKAALGAPAIALGLIGVFTQRQRLRVGAPILWFAAFLAWAFVGYLSAENPATALDALWSYSKIGLIFLLALNVAHSRNELRWMMVAWLGIFALYPVRGTLFNVAYGITTQGRYAWNFIFSNPNDLTTLTIPMLAMSVAMLQWERERWVRYCALAGVIVLPMIIFATQSRGGILALFTFGALVLLQYRKRLGAILLGIMVAGAVIQLAPPGVWSRLGSLSKVTSAETIGQADPWGSAQQRYDIWRVARGVIADHPVFGVGLESYGEVHERYAATGRFPGAVLGARDAHSTFLRTAAETGLPGLALFLGMLAATFVGGWRALTRLKTSDPSAATSLRTLLFGLIAFLQASLFASMEMLPFMYLYIAVIGTFIAVNLTTPSAPAPPPLPRRRG